MKGSYSVSTWSQSVPSPHVIAQPLLFSEKFPGMLKNFFRSFTDFCRSCERSGGGGGSMPGKNNKTLFSDSWK